MQTVFVQYLQEYMDVTALMKLYMGLLDHTGHLGNVFYYMAIVRERSETKN